MAQFIGPVIDKLLEVLVARTTTFVEFGRLFTGAPGNLPACWVMAARTQFGEEEGTLHQAHQITVKFGVQADTPDGVIQAALAGMKEIHLAIEASWPADWVGAVPGGVVTEIYIREHDYGLTWERGAGLAKFPELDVFIETQELRNET